MSAAIAPAALAITAALFDSLWEGALIAGAAWLGLRCLPKLGAATRYAIWLCALATIVIVPVLTVGVSDRTSATAADAVSTTEQTSTSRPAALQRIHTARVAPEPAVAAGEIPASAPRKPRIAISQGLAVAVALIWILAFCARGFMLWLDGRALDAIRREAWLWSAAREYPVFLSNHVQVPLAAGFLRPAILLPASLVVRLPAEALETIVVHELAHLRRYDVWTNGFARVVEAFVALNPVAWFVMRRLSMEREIACDDWVVARTGAGDAFARALATLATSARGRAPLAAASALGTRHSVVVRIERLLDAGPRRLRLSPPALGGTFVLLALIAFTLQSVSPVLAYEPQRLLLAQASPQAQTSGACAVPNRGIRLTPKASPPLEWELNAPRFISRFGASNVATFDLTVDAHGKPSNVAVLSAPHYPGMVEHVTHFLMSNTYEPELRNCTPVTATLKGAGLPFLVRPPYTQSVLAPVYPTGWSAQHPSACKVPAVTHDRSSVLGPNPKTEMLPAFASTMKDMSVDAKYHASVRVHVNDAGAATTASLVRSSGQRAFDDAVMTAARRATYPLDASACKPLPAEYVWNTTFSRGTFP